ncbi:MAG: hypothetical protein IMW97_04995 [Firmicutes bacterium]|nr:hypothetical protein [Candidatus Fermentithermobacillaceae bacterium]
MNTPLPGVDIPEQLADFLEKIRGRVRIMVVGRPDTGKSTLAFALASWLRDRGKICAVVDCDVGQADIGPPGFVSYGLMSPHVSGVEMQPDGAPCGGCGAATPCVSGGSVERDSISRMGSYLVGDVSPYGRGDARLLAMVAGASACVEAAERDGAETVVVDTTGLALFSDGLRLKCAKADAIRPDVIVLLSSANDSRNSPEGILGNLLEAQGHNVLKLAASTGARRRSPEERRENRIRQWNRYLEKSSLHRLDLGKVRVFRWWADSGFVVRTEENSQSSLPARDASVHGHLPAPPAGANAGAPSIAPVLSPAVRSVSHGTVVAVPDPHRKGLHIPGIWVTDELGPGILTVLPPEQEIETVWVTSYQTLISRGRVMSG